MNLNWPSGRTRAVIAVDPSGETRVIGPVYADEAIARLAGRLDATPGWQFLDVIPLDSLAAAHRQLADDGQSR